MLNCWVHVVVLSIIIFSYFLIQRFNCPDETLYMSGNEKQVNLNLSFLVSGAMSDASSYPEISKNTN